MTETSEHESPRADRPMTASENHQTAALYGFALCPHCGKPARVDDEGPTTWFLCCNTSVPKETRRERCAVCGGLNPGDVTHARC